jgi:hypothetical protein
MKSCRAVVALLICSLLAACHEEQHHWEGLVYPKTGTMPFDLAIGHFATLEACRASALTVLAKTLPEPGSVPDYECGYKCTISTTPPPQGVLATRVCEVTAK